MADPALVAVRNRLGGGARRSHARRPPKPRRALRFSHLEDLRAKARGVDDAGDPYSGDLKSNGLLFNAALRYQAAPSVNLVGRLGLANLKTKASEGIGGGSTTSTKPYFGIGAEYELNKQLRLTAGADFTRAKFEGETSSVRLLSIGAQYDF